MWQLQNPRNPNDIVEGNNEDRLAFLLSRGWTVVSDNHQLQLTEIEDVKPPSNLSKLLADLDKE